MRSIFSHVLHVYIAVDMNNEEADDDYFQWWSVPWCRLQMSDWPEWWMTGVTINLRFNTAAVSRLNIVVVLPAAPTGTTNIKTSIGDVMEILIWPTISSSSPTYNKTLLGTTITSTNTTISTKIKARHGPILSRKTIRLRLPPQHGQAPLRHSSWQIPQKVQTTSNTIRRTRHRQLQPVRSPQLVQQVLWKNAKL